MSLVYKGLNYAINNNSIKVTVLLLLIIVLALPNHHIFNNVNNKFAINDQYCNSFLTNKVISSAMS